jgi:hypothetical protein
LSPIIGDGAEQRDLEDAFGGLYPAIGAKDFGDAGQRVDAAKFGGEVAHHKAPAR